MAKTNQHPIMMGNVQAAGRPATDGESGGVPFTVAVSDLQSKTEKGRTVNRELWGDDDIFVAVDIYPIDSKKRILFAPAPPCSDFAALLHLLLALQPFFSSY